ncbi:MAG TPA: energy transducer TonB [Polyangia bacterium]
MLAMVVLALVQAQAIDAGAPVDAAPPSADAAASRLSGDAAVKPPVLKHFVPAVYPPDAEAAGIAGSVMLSIVIDETGKVGDVKVLDPGPNPGFAPAAVAAVKQFGFAPAEIAGKPAAVEIS